MNRTEWQALSAEERRGYANPDRSCIERGCDEPAGTPWGPHWCADHDDARLERVSAGFASVLAAFPESTGA